MAILEVEHINKTFGRTEVLKDISFSLERGQVLSLIGSSGSGKTTLLRCLNFLETPDKGVIRVNDELLFDAANPVTKQESEIRKKRLHFGLVFQSFNLFPQYTALGNVMLAKELLAKSQPDYKARKKEIHAEIEAEAKNLLDQMGLSERMNNYPSQLSGGQKQRVGIARALASNPKVLLCDEATSALDPQTTDSILKLLKNINEKMGLTIVLITHEMHVIREICDRVAVIEGGVILEEGSTVEVFTHPRENTTKEFISSVVSDNLPPEALEHLELHDQWIAGTAPLVRLKFTGQATDEPVVAGLVRRFNLDVSILFGGIDYIQNTSVGRLIVILNGDPENAQEGLDYIKTLPIESEVIGYVRANH